MEQADVTSLVMAEDVIPLEESIPKACTFGNYESFESFMQTLAPSVELPGTDDSSILSGITSSNPGTGEIASSGADSEVVETAISPGADSEAVSTPGEEVKRLKDLVVLLQVRLDATTQVVEIQEKELCREIEGEEETRSNYARLLTRWRREVCILLLKQRVDALHVEQRRLQQTQKEQHLTVQFHEARAVVEVLKQKERNLQAEIGILTTGQKLAEMTMRAEAARRQHEVEGTVKGVTRAAVEALCNVVDEHSAIIFQRLERLAQASSRLDLYGERLTFIEQQMMMVVNNASFDRKSFGTHTHREKFEGTIHIEKPRSVDRRRTQPTEHVVRRFANDQAGRANQLEVLLAATKSQLTEECMHARELQGKIGKIELDGREAVKRATRKAQDQAERDLVAIKRQHSQTVQSLQNRISRLQNEHARSIVAHHQLGRRLSQQQQEFVHTLNQRDNEFRKSLDAKEIEVNGLLDEQNALLNKLKKFWRPILNSSAAKIFTEKNQRSQLQSPSSSQYFTPQESKIKDSDNIATNMRSVQTQTVVVDVKREKKKTKEPDDNAEADQDNKIKQEQKDIKDTKLNKAGSQSLSRLSTPSKKNKRDSKVKKTEEDLISSYLNKLEKSYVTSNKQHSYLRENMYTRTLNSLAEDKRDIESYPTTPLPNRQDHHDGRAEARPISRPSPAFSDCQSTNDEPLPQYIMCVTPQDARCGNANYVKSQRKKQAAENSTTNLQEKLENLEALSETLLGQRM